MNDVAVRFMLKSWWGIMTTKDFYALDYSVGRPVPTRWDDLILGKTGLPSVLVEKEGRLKKSTGLKTFK